MDSKKFFLPKTYEQGKDNINMRIIWIGNRADDADFAHFQSAAIFTRSRDKLPAVAGAEVGSNPVAGEGNHHLLVLLHTGAALLLDILAEVAEALQDPCLSFGSQLLQPPSPCQCCDSTRPTVQSSLVRHRHQAEELQLQELLVQEDQSQEEQEDCHRRLPAVAQSSRPPWSCQGCDSSQPTGQSSRRLRHLQDL